MHMHMHHSPYVCLAISVVFAFMIGLVVLMVVVAKKDGETDFGPAPAEDGRGEPGGGGGEPGGAGTVGPMTWKEYNR